MKFNICLLIVFVLLMYIIPLRQYAKPMGDYISVKNTQNNPAKEVVVSTVETDNSQEENSTQEPIQPTSWDGVSLDEPFRILDETTGKILTVDQKEYVRGAVCAEMPPDFHTEALKAQAVAAHTYALYNKMNQSKNPDPSLKGADFKADPQNWKVFVYEEQAKERFGDNFSVYYKKIADAADAVFSQVMLYEEEPIIAAYHSTSAGLTEDAANVWQGSVPYLTAVESEGDKLAPDFKTTETFSVQTVKEKLTAKFPDITLPKDSSGWFEVIERSPGGYILSMKAGDKELHGKDFRAMFGLRSSSVVIVNKGENFTFTVSGYGHGVGLSQYGADFMAQQGNGYDEILQHYYTDIELVEITS